MPQVKQDLASSVVKFMQELLQELPNDLSKTNDPRELRRIRKISKFHRDIVNFSSRNKSLFMASKITQKQISKFFAPVHICLMSLPGRINFF